MEFGNEVQGSRRAPRDGPAQGLRRLPRIVHPESYPFQGPSHYGESGGRAFDTRGGMKGVRSMVGPSRELRVILSGWRLSSVMNLRSGFSAMSAAFCSGRWA